MYIDIYIMHDKDENTPGAVVFNEPIRQALDNDSHLFVLENCVEDMLGIQHQHQINSYKAYCYINKIGENGKILGRNGKQLYKIFLMKERSLNN